MSEKIVVSIDLDDQKFQSSIDDSAKNTEEKFKKVSVEIEKNLSNSFNGASRSAEKLGTILGGIGVSLLTSPPAGKGLFGTISKLSFASGSLLVISETLGTIDSQLAQIGSTAFRVASFIAGGLAAALTFAIIKGSELAQSVGSKLVASLQKLRDASNDFVASQNVLTKVIENYNFVTGNAVGTTEEWASVIASLSQSLNISTKDLNKSAQEIISVGSQIGLTAEQMKLLTQVSAEYAKVNNKDVFETTMALINGLNGNSQAAQNLGIKLTEASVRAFAFKEGITESFESLSDNEKVQIRFNKLLSQYNNIAGIAQNVAGQLADQENALSVVLEKLNARFGQGVAIVENYNIVSKALGTVANNLNGSFVEAAGFISALGARFIQITGYIVEYTFKLFLLSKAITLYNLLTSGSISLTTLFNTKLKLINMSLAQLIVFATGGRIGLEQINRTTGSLTESMKKLFSSFLVFKSSGSISIFESIKQVFATIFGFAGKLLSGLTPVLLVFTKFVAIGALVVAPFILLKNAIQELEERTKVFSTLYNVLGNELSKTSAIFEPVVRFFGNIGESIKELASKGFGLFVFGLSKVVQALTELALKNPFNVFSEQTIAKISEVNGKLQQFSTDLKMVAFDISKIPGEAERAIAGSTNKSTVNIEELVQKLNALRDQFKDFGLTDAEVIRKREAEALETLRLSYENKLIAEKEYQTLRQQVIQDANNKVKELDTKAAQDRQKILSESNRIINQGLANALSGGIQNIVKSVASGENIFKNFSSFIVQTFGDLAIQLGQFFIATGLATAALLKLSPGAMIAAGAGLVALGAILKSFVGKGLGGGGGGGVAPIGAQPSPGEFTTPDVASPESVEREKPTTNVSVVVQGSLVRQDELGQFITETLNESFAKQGVTLTDARFA